jgi:hypothetical protein
MLAVGCFLYNVLADQDHGKALTLWHHGVLAT